MEHDHYIVDLPLSDMQWSLYNPAHGMGNESCSAGLPGTLLDYRGHTVCMVKFNGQCQRTLTSLGECWLTEVLDYRQIPLCTVKPL